MLIKGLLVFFVLGMLIFLGVLSVEYVLWLNPTGRMLLLLLGVISEAYLLLRFILRPLFYLFKFRQGISHKEASLLIGRHFPEVGDKLYNLFDLAEDQDKSELLQASIEQRSKQLGTVPFSRAIDFTEAFRMARYIIIPISILLVVWVSGNLSGFFGSYERVVNYATAYQPPAPFVYEVIMGELRALENEAFTVQVRTRGSVKPEHIAIHVSGREYQLEESQGTYSFTFEPPLQTARFYFEANGITSQTYLLEALKVPSLEDFRMELHYPAYINKPDDIVRSSGNATFPEGTTVTWTVRARNTESVGFYSADTVVDLTREADEFTLAKRIYRSQEYQIGTSNENVQDFEALRYRLTVIKDAYPVLKIREFVDSLDLEQRYYVGEVSDDYGLSSIDLVVYPEEEPDSIQEVGLMRPRANFEQFYYTFPTGVRLVEGVNYAYYFRATDNDGIHKGKSSRSQVFRMRVLNEEEKGVKQLESQEKLLKGMDRTLEEYKREQEEYEAINKRQREKESLNFREQSQIREFLDKQKQQEQMMEKFSRELKDNLEKKPVDDTMNRLLRERLERQEMEARRNAALLDELKEVANKINREELTKRLEELGKQRQSNERSLEQILELTKRYYVTEKSAQLARDLEKLAKEQKALAREENGEQNTVKSQEVLQDKFSKSALQLEDLLKENRGLKKPLRIGADQEDADAVKKLQEGAVEELSKSQGKEALIQGEGANKEKESARKKQQEAGSRMQQMSEALQQGSMGAEGESSMAEDAEMLRQVLDNLVTFSFKQERLIEGMELQGADLANYASEVRDQQQLKQLFTHIDDSLFALSLRRAEISELVNNQIAEVYYNVDKALESITDNRIYQGVSHQQYVLTSANTLADFLASLLDNMQQSLAMGSGQGK